MGCLPRALVQEKISALNSILDTMATKRKSSSRRLGDKSVLYGKIDNLRSVAKDFVALAQTCISPSATHTLLKNSMDLCEKHGAGVYPASMQQKLLKLLSLENIRVQDWEGFFSTTLESSTSFNDQGLFAETLFAQTLQKMVKGMEQAWSWVVQFRECQ